MRGFQRDHRDTRKFADIAYNSAAFQGGDRAEGSRATCSRRAAHPWPGDRPDALRRLRSIGHSDRTFGTGRLTLIGMSGRDHDPRVIYRRIGRGATAHSTESQWLTPTRNSGSLDTGTVALTQRNIHPSPRDAGRGWSGRHLSCSTHGRPPEPAKPRLRGHANRRRPAPSGTIAAEDTREASSRASDTIDSNHRIHSIDDIFETISAVLMAPLCPWRSRCRRRRPLPWPAAG